MAGPFYPAENNTYVPNHEASGKLVVDFSRNPNKFALAKYAQIIPPDKIKQSNGLYLKMTVEEAGRITTADGAEFDWPDGAPAPQDTDGTESFQYLPFTTRRSKLGFQLGWKTARQAPWDIVARHAAIKAQQAMTLRTVRAVAALTTAGNYDASHVADVTSGITGNSGTWAASTTARQDIKRSLNYALNTILKDTLSAVEGDETVLVIGPDDAAKIAQTQEIVDHVKGSPQAWAQVRGELPGRNAQMYGLPDKLYGYELVIENTVKVTSRKKAGTTVRSFAWPSGTAVLCSRPGGLEGVAGAPSFSTLTGFFYEEMTVEQKDDSDNRLTWGRVVEDYAFVMTAPVSGFVFTGI